MAFLVFLAFFMTFVLNYQYALRMIMLSVLFITFPIVLLSMISPVRREAMTIWMHEFISNVFMQAAHAFTLVLFFIIRDQMGVGNLSFWVLAACLFALPVVATLFQRFIGAFSGVPTGSNSVMGNMGAMFGVAAVANMGRMLGQMSGKGGGGRGRVSSPTPSNGPAPTPSVSPRTSGGLQQVPTGSGLAQAMDAKSSSRWPSGKAVMGGLGTMAAQRGKQIGRGAAIGAGIATGGTVSAMMTGNPAIGGAVGALAGNKAANNAGSMADRAKRATELMKQYDQSGLMEEGLYEGSEGQGGTPSVNALDQAQDAGKLPQSSDDKFQNSLTNGEKSAQDLLNGLMATASQWRMDLLLKTLRWLKRVPT
ncbi:hypothetical protein JCM19055_4778 [Geomicrobium sp. JCM 19055]|nr:hypothetical protein JCM19055_4778 [Geomicrobium sp. JCM 19055]